MKFRHLPVTTLPDVTSNFEQIESEVGALLATVSMVWRGAWLTTNQYAVGSVVKEAGHLYYALVAQQPSLGTKPGSAAFSLVNALETAEAPFAAVGWAKVAAYFDKGETAINGWQSPSSFAGGKPSGAVYLTRSFLTPKARFQIKVLPGASRWVSLWLGIAGVTEKRQGYEVEALFTAPEEATVHIYRWGAGVRTELAKVEKVKIKAEQLLEVKVEAGVVTVWVSGIEAGKTTDSTPYVGPFFPGMATQGNLGRIEKLEVESPGSAYWELMI